MIVPTIVITLLLATLILWYFMNKSDTEAQSQSNDTDNHKETQTHVPEINLSKVWSLYENTDENASKYNQRFEQLNTIFQSHFNDSKPDFYVRSPGICNQARHFPKNFILKKKNKKNGKTDFSGKHSNKKNKKKNKNKKAE